MKNGLKKIGRGIVRALCSVIPMVGDPKREWARKIAFLAALFVFIGSAAYLIDAAGFVLCGVFG